MRKYWYVVGFCLMTLVILIGFAWKYATHDPLARTFGKLRTGMTTAKVTAILAEGCDNCELIPDEDSYGTRYSVMWNWDSFHNPKEMGLIGGFGTTHGNSSYIWLEFENGTLKDAGRTHNYLFYLNLPQGSHWEHLYRGYTVTERECLTESCEKGSSISGGIITYDERADWQRIKKWISP